MGKQLSVTSKFEDRRRKYQCGTTKSDKPIFIRKKCCRDSLAESVELQEETSKELYKAQGSQVAAFNIVYLPLRTHATGFSRLFLKEKSQQLLIVSAQLLGDAS